MYPWSHKHWLALSAPIDMVLLLLGHGVPATDSAGQ
jgi:hypothetical protein